MKKNNTLVIIHNTSIHTALSHTHRHLRHLVLQNDATKLKCFSYCVTILMVLLFHNTKL